LFGVLGSEVEEWKAFCQFRKGYESVSI